MSGGEGSELYRVEVPDAYLGLSVDEVSAKLRADHRATLLSISRAGKAYVNPPSDFVIMAGDDAVVVAESLGTLAPLVMKHEENGSKPADQAGPAAAADPGAAVAGSADVVGPSAPPPQAAPGSTTQAIATGSGSGSSAATTSATPAPIVPQALYQPPTSSGQSGEATGSAVGIAAPPATASAMAPLVSVVSAPPAVVIPVVPLESSPAQTVSIVPMPSSGERNGKDPKRKKKHGKR